MLTEIIQKYRQTTTNKHRNNKTTPTQHTQQNSPTGQRRQQKSSLKQKNFQQPIKIGSFFIFKKMDTFHWTSRPGPAGDGPTVWCGYANLTNHVWESDVEDQS